MTQRDGYARRRYASVFTVLTALLGVLLCVCCACAPMSDTAIGHSYSQKNAQEYFPRDDDGDIKDVRVDFISPTTRMRLQADDVRSVADALTRTDIAAYYREAGSATEQMAQVRIAAKNYSKLICIPAESITEENKTQWNRVLRFVRSRGIPVALVAETEDITISHVSVDPLYYAAIWRINSAGRSSQDAFDIVMTIVEDKPHDTIMRSTLR